jgi:hypothetical protein
MSFVSFFETTEADAVKVIVKIKAGVEYTAHELATAFNWLVAHAGQIAAGVSTVSQAVGTLAAAGVNMPPQVATAIKDANIAVAGLNAMAADASKGTAEALVAGYVAAKQASNAVNAAAIAVANVPPVTPAAAPSA